MLGFTYKLIPCSCAFWILCNDVTVDFIRLLVCAFKTAYFSEYFVFISCCFSFNGKSFLVCGKLRHFFPNFNKSFCLLSYRGSKLRIPRACSYPSYLSCKIFLNAFCWTFSREILSYSVRSLCHMEQDCSRMLLMYNI